MNPFLYPWMVVVVLLAVLAGGMLLRRFLRLSREDEGPFVQMRNWIPDFEKTKRKHIFLYAALIFLFVALMRPAWGEKENIIRYEGLDIVFALDVSRSMNAEDFSTQNRTINRLKVAKELIKNFIQKRPQDRFSLINFSGDSFVSVPLTFDHHIFLNFLEQASREDVNVGGTNLSDVIGTSIERLTVRENDQRGKAMILITDGDQTFDRNIGSIAALAAQKKIPIFTVGIGSLEGTRIPQGRDVFGSPIYLQYQGRDVITKLNEETLETIAQVSGGRYFHAGGFEDLQNLTEDLNRLPTQMMEKLNITDREERYAFFVGMAFFLFLLFLFYSDTQKPQKNE